MRTGAHYTFLVKMPSCAVLICKSRSAEVNYKSDGITYHRFPHQPERKIKWMQATGRGPQYWPIKSSTICSRHFGEKCFQVTNKSRRLFEWAVPTLHLRHDYPNVSSETDIKKEERPMEDDIIEQIECRENNKELNHDHEKIKLAVQICDDENSQGVQNEIQGQNKQIKLEVQICDDENSAKSVLQGVHKECKGQNKQGTANIYKINITDTPLNRKLKLELGRCVNQIQMQKIKIKRLQKQNSRYQKKNAELEDIVKHKSNKKQLQQKKYVNEKTGNKKPKSSISQQVQNDPLEIPEIRNLN